MGDFITVETTHIRKDIESRWNDEFELKTYSPRVFRIFREWFCITEEILTTMLTVLYKLNNPGLGESEEKIFVTDEIVVKTVQRKEVEFLRKMLPGYYLEIDANPRTLLPKFFGLYCYQCNSKNTWLVAMNNILLSCVKLHQKYELKGSTYKRRASEQELQNGSSTYKDLDFMEHYPEGIFLEECTYASLIRTIAKDCGFLERFGIMDYSLLLGIYNLDEASREKTKAYKHTDSTSGGEDHHNDSASRGGEGQNNDLATSDGEGRGQHNDSTTSDCQNQHNDSASRGDEGQGHYIYSATSDGEGQSQHTDSATRGGEGRHNDSVSRGGEGQGQHTDLAIRGGEGQHNDLASSDEKEDLWYTLTDSSQPAEHIMGIPAWNARGDRLRLYVGIINILQTYGTREKLQHTWNSIIRDGDTVSVHRPRFYAQRFRDFIGKDVFKKVHHE